jgi:teichuronic acid biosynthesis glycosyltransferase TuaC
MRVLFISSGNKNKTVSPIISSQGESLTNKNVAVDYFPITGKPLVKYLSSIILLRKHLKLRKYDILHAHYSLSGWVAVLGSGGIPVILSLMGDDIQGTFTSAGKIKFRSRLLILTTKMIQPFVKAIISKSENLTRNITRKEISYIIPNGVQLNKFRSSGKGYRKELGLSEEKKYILFLGDPDDPNKNISLVKAAVKLLNRKDVELLSIFNTPHKQVVKYMNSADVFTLCSFGEGSPNVLKEAMACNCPLVATETGDVRWVIGDTPGCYISSYDTSDFAEKLLLALKFSEECGRTRGRDRISELGLDSDSVAERLIKVYRGVLG